MFVELLECCLMVMSATQMSVAAMMFSMRRTGREATTSMSNLRGIFDKLNTIERRS